MKNILILLFYYDKYNIDSLIYLLNNKSIKYQLLNILETNYNLNNIKFPISHLIVMGSSHHALMFENTASLIVKSRVFHIFNICIVENIPILGICYGCQLINIYFGGTLKFVDKDKFTRYKGIKTNYLSIGNKYYSINTRFSNTFCIDKIAKDLDIIGITDDIISIIKYNKNPYIIGYQFHPERQKETMRFIEQFINI